MPILKDVTTKSSDLIWTSPDGERELYKVDLEYEGKPFSAKTYSKAIIDDNFRGDVELEERPGKKGIETFVKQAPKENSGYNPTAGSKPAGNHYQPRDDSHIKAQWAIGQAMSLVTLETLDYRIIESIAIELFTMVDRVKNSEPLEHEVPKDGDTEEVKGLDEIFKDIEPEKPWLK